jgi:hypothetical protein
MTASWTGVTNQNLPTADAAYPAAVLPFNDDLAVDLPAAKVFTAPATWDGASAVVVEWHNVRFYDNAVSSVRLTFQVRASAGR